MQRLISYNHKGLRQWGVLTEDSKSIIPAELLEETYFIPLGETMDEFIETGDEKSQFLSIQNVIFSV